MVNDDLENAEKQILKSMIYGHHVEKSI
jgi:hypothetical protein